jgi:hypothetical protein
MSTDPGPRAAPQAPFRELALAVERHMQWAYDFTLAGDLEAALDALCDARAASLELTEPALP